MKKLLIWTVLLLTATLSTYAQNKIVTVSGRVIEAGTKEPVELAAVQLLSLPDSAQVAGMTTSTQGYFSLSKQKPGKYLLKVSFIGYVTKIIPVQLTANVPAKKMGKAIFLRFGRNILLSRIKRRRVIRQESIILPADCS